MRLEGRVVFSAMALLLMASCTNTNKKIELNSDEQKLSYAIGQQIGQGIKQQGLKVDPAVLAQSIADVTGGTPSRLSDEQIQKVMASTQEKMMQKQQGEQKENKEKGEKYLAENAKRKEVKTTKSGLQYEVVKDGAGTSPKVSDVVKVHYRGTLIDGAEFDSSYKRNTPAEFPVGGVIPGWTEALQMMKPGAKWKLYIPSDLAYGPQGRPSIPPNSVLLFEVELLSIEKKK
jgi:FKBP-type peptidyl-prolyl cis-trans isomerase